MKLAFIAPRYGADVAAGAEHACRLLAEQVCARHQVDVLTTCARDARLWKNEYSEGADRVRGVIVRRFAVAQTHDHIAFQQYTERLTTRPPTRADEHEWVRRLGPVSPGLLDYLKRQHRTYDALVFFSLWHATTVQGLQIAPERSILFPYLHLQPALRFGLWRDVLSSAKVLALFSAVERQLIHRYVGVAPRHEEMVGIGIDPPPRQAYPRHQQDPADALPADEDEPAADAVAEEDTHLTARGAPFRRRHRLYGPFALYGGRVQPGNGCEEMLEYFDEFAATDGDMALVLMGVKMMKIPEERYLRFAGVLPERERMVASEAADVTLAPAPDDLLAQTVLESFAVGTPVLASAGNLAAVEHCRKSNGGLYYANREEFREGLALLRGNGALRAALGANGLAYIRQHFRWDAVLGRFERAISKTKGK